MKSTFIEKKIPNGKMVKIKLEFDTRITHMQIQGDFFLHPEETIFQIESALLSMPIDASAEAFGEKINSVLVESKADLLGVSPVELGRIISEGIQNAR